RRHDALDVLLRQARGLGGGLGAVGGRGEVGRAVFHGGGDLDALLVRRGGDDHRVGAELALDQREGGLHRRRLELLHPHLLGLLGGEGAAGDEGRGRVDLAGREDGEAGDVAEGHGGDGAADVGGAHDQRGLILGGGAAGGLLEGGGDAGERAGVGPAAERILG